MALVPYLAALGATLGQAFDRSDVKAMQPDEEETKELRNHVIIAGYGRVGQMIGQMLSEELIPFVAVDIDSNRCGACSGWVGGGGLWGAGAAAGVAKGGWRVGKGRHCR